MQIMNSHLVPAFLLVILVISSLCLADDYRDKFCSKSSSEAGLKGTAGCVKKFMTPEVETAYLNCKKELNGQDNKMECWQYIGLMCKDENIYKKVDMCMTKNMTPEENAKNQELDKQMLKCVSDLAV